MSARPDVPRLSEEELDLLISRSLDGDLSPEEEQQLERLVALDPAAARRKAELAALVADVKALPEPATPFALATRVNSNVAERGRPGSLGGRIGFFPAPGFAKAALVILGIVGASIAILRPAPKRLAEGPVDVYLYNPATPAAPAPQALIAEAKPARARELAKERAKEVQPGDAKDAEKNQKFAPEADEKRRDAPAEEAGQKKAEAKLEVARQNESAAASSLSNVVAEAAPKQKVDRDEAGVIDGLRQQAPAKVTNAGALADAAPAPAAPAPAAAPAAGGSLGAAGSRTPRGWTVSVRGDAVRRWSLRRAPDNPPPARGAAVYRVTLDASGRVTALSRVGAAAADPRLDAFVRGMVFEPIAPPAESQARAAARDTAAASADFEIGLEPR
ncbi:MAG: hypothetical protein IPL89_06065 [Acidobacteria bacterium]|nr:hypothetical protein [Acidobacteriota bacterium]